MLRADSLILKTLVAALLLIAITQLMSASGTISTAVIASDAQVGNSTTGSTLATSGGQKLVQDSYGRMIAVYVDSNGKLALRYANSNQLSSASWSSPFSRGDAVPYANPAAVLVNSTSLRVIVEGGVATGYIVDVPVTISRDAQQNISTLIVGSPRFVDSSSFANYPTAILAHTGDILAAWNWLATTNSSRVKTLRWNHLTDNWVNFAGSSPTPDSPIIDTSSITPIFPSIIERNDTVRTVYVLGNRGNAGPANLVFNEATFVPGNLSWSWAVQNAQTLNYETNAAHGIEDDPSLTWDAVKSVIVVAYAKTGSSQYNVFTLTSTDVKTHLDTPVLPGVATSAQDYGRLNVNQTSGDYFIFFQNSASDAGNGSIVYVRSPGGSNSWNTTLITIDSNTNNRGISLRKVGATSSFDLLYENDGTFPAQIRLARVTSSTRPQPLTVSFSYTPLTPSPGQSVNFTGTASGGTPPYSYAWAFGDGATGAGASITHTYTNNGTFTVGLAATDRNGNTASSQNTLIVSSGRFTFAAAGDWDFNLNTQANWNSLSTAGVNFVIPVGDFLYATPTPTKNEQTWCSTFKGNVQNVELIVGNHETWETNFTGGGGSINKFLQYCPFTLGTPTGTYGFQYYFDYPSPTPLARFILVDADIWLGNTGSSAAWYGNDTAAGRANQAWVTAAVTDARTRGISWVVVATHKDCISTGAMDCEISQSFMDLLIRNHVDLVLEGHDHNYQRSKELSCATADIYRSSCVANPGPDYTKGTGTIFLIVGTGGNVRNAIDTTDGDYQYFATTDSSTNGYEKFTVTGTGIQGQFIRTADGSFTDNWTVGTTDLPPVVNFTPSTTTAGKGQAITLTISASDPDGTITTTRVDWGDGTVHTFTGAATSDNHSYSSPGNFTVTVTATDNAGLPTSRSAIIRITNIPPTARFTETLTTAPTLTSIGFDASGSSDPDGTITNYSWNFGDGSSATGATASHSYGTSGTFNVTLTVTDNDGSIGTSRATKTITDRPPNVSFTESTTTAQTGTSITLTITASDPDGTVSSLKVVWGDGTAVMLPGNATTASHSYGSTGNTKSAIFNVYVNATDNSAVTTKSATATKTISDRAPTVSFTETLTTANTGQTITLTITSADPDGTVSSLKVVWGDGTIDTLAGTSTTASHSYSSTGTTPTATFSVYVNATDNSGSITKSSAATKTITDRSPSVGFTESLTTANTGQTITLTITSSDPDGTVTSLKVAWGDGTIDTLAGTATTDSHSYANTDGAKTEGFTVYVNATDNSVVTTKSSTATKTINDRAPTVAFTESATSAPTGTSITLTITSTDPDGSVSILKVIWGDGTVDTLAGTATSDSHAYGSTGSTPTATFTVYVNATDNSGSVTKSTTATKTISDRPPTISFTESATTANTGVTISLTITSSDIDGTISQTVVSWGDGAIHTLAGPATSDSHAYANTGNSGSQTFSVTVTVTDNGGDTAISNATKTINDRPPSVSFTENLATANPGQKITLTITSSDPDGTIVQTMVNWGDGTIDLVNNQRDSHTYSSGGAYNVTVTVTDNSQSTASVSATKTINDQPPVVSFNESASIAPSGTTITLTITASDPDGTLTSIEVVWGDGVVDSLSVTATTDSHAYSIAGTFTVYVNATDNANLTTKSNSATKTITDRPPSVNFTESATSTSTGTSITLTIASSDPDGTVSSLKVVWGDGTVNTLAGTATSDSHTYTAANTYIVYVNATDNSAQTTKSATATKTITAAVINVSFTENTTTATTGQTITLTITASVSGGTISSLKIVWGDGTMDTLSGTATTDSHAYASTGSTPTATFTVYVNATDNTGRTQKSASTVKTISDRAPTVSFIESLTTANTGQTITLTISSSDHDGTVSSLKVSWGDGTVDTLAGTATSDSHAYASTGSAPTATFTVHVNATDNSAVTTESSTATKTVSDRAPAVSFTESATTAQPLTSITITISSSDPDGVVSGLRVVWGDGTIDNLAGDATSDSHAYLLPGSYTVYVNASDNAGVTTKSSISTKTIASFKPPRVSFSEDKTSTSTGQTITLTISASDPNAGGSVTSLKVVWGDGTIDSLPGNATTDTHSYSSTGSNPTSTFQVYVNATNNYALTNQSAPATKNIADRPPRISFTESTTTALTGISIALTINTSDPDGTVNSLKVVWGDGTIDMLPGTANSASHAYASTGSTPTATFTVYMNATDNSAVTTESSTATKTISDKAPTVSFTETLTTANTGQSITLTITAADPDGTVSSLKVVWGDGATDALAGTVTSDSHAYASTGNAKQQLFTVYMNATDNSGVTTKSASTTKTILDKPPIAVFFFSPSNPIEGQIVGFNGTSSADPDGNVVSYAWNFGDGSAGSGNLTSHQYTVRGSFNVTLTVTDNSGSQGTASTILNVEVDGTKPSWPPNTSLSITNVHSAGNLTGLVLSWTPPANDDGGIALYNVFSNNISIGRVAGTLTSYNVTGLTAGTYTFRVEAVDYAGLSSTDGPKATLVVHRLAGDVNDDCKVDIVDLSSVGAAFGKTTGTTGFNPAADFNGDGKITIIDLVVVASNFGRVC